MKADSLRLDGLVRVAEEIHRIDLAALRARAAHARLAVDDDAVEAREPALDQRRRRENGADRIAPRRRDECRARDRLAMQLGQPVDRMAEPGGIEVRGLI